MATRGSGPHSCGPLYSAVRRCPRRQPSNGFSCQDLGRAGEGHDSFVATLPGMRHSWSNPDPHLDVWGSILVRSDTTAPHNIGILQFWVLDFRWQGFHFPRCRTRLALTEIRTKHNSSSKSKPPVWSEWGYQHTWRGEVIAFPLKGQGWSILKE